MLAMKSNGAFDKTVYDFKPVGLRSVMFSHPAPIGKTIFSKDPLRGTLKLLFCQFKIDEVFEELRIVHRYGAFSFFLF
jgi:hypothetical protein